MSQPPDKENLTSFLGIAMNSGKAGDYIGVDLSYDAVAKAAQHQADVVAKQLDEELEATWGAVPLSETSNLTLQKLEASYRKFKETMRGPLSHNDKLRLIELRNQETEMVWHPEAAKGLRDLAFNSGIALSIIARAAKGEPYYKIRVPDRYVEEYKRWRRVWEVTKRITKGK
jgi:hypothetical protein